MGFFNLGPRFRGDDDGERGDDTGAPLELDLHSIAEKFIEQYWPHAAPYGAADGAPAVLVQNHGRQAAIVARVAQARGRFGSLARAKSDRSWRGFAEQPRAYS